MTSRGSTLTRAEALSNWEELTLAISNRLARGENISIPLFYIGQDIQGEYDSADDNFKSGRNQVIFNISATDALKSIASKITVQKVEAIKLVPVIKSVLDFATNTNNQITVGNTVRLLGSSLKIDTADVEQGVFLIPVLGGAEVKLNTFIDNQPSTLTFMIPSTLPKAAYRIEVRAKINKTKELRISSFAEVVTAI